MKTSTGNFRHLIEEIRQKYEAYRGEEISPLYGHDKYIGHASQDLYSDEFHFILEFIQNAVDSRPQFSDASNATVHIQFQLKIDPLILVVSNNGLPFSEADIKRLCDVTKERKGPKKIGYKGIGFKSVGLISYNPQIYSVDCRFEFNKKYHPDYQNLWLVIPHWLESPPKPDIDISASVTFVLPLREDLSPDEVAQLSNQLDSPELLLFLEGLEQLKIENEYSRQGLQVHKRDDQTGLTITSITETSNSFTITRNGQIVAKADWLTKNQGEQAGYDFCVVENGISTYYEVKSTIMEVKEWFDVSRKQWEFAQEQGEQFFILRVYNVGAENVRVEKICNPYKLWQEGSLTAYPVRIQI